ncbi:MAG: heme-binding protein [Bacteriovoracaceae bacterium]
MIRLISVTYFLLTSLFQDALKRNGELTYGEPIFARYNSPFQIWFLRRNEIWINISEAPPHLKKVN